MRKIFKIIPVFSLWIASLALVFHLIIPHDHHLIESFSNQADSCPEASSNNSNHHRFPVHCHAFNDIASEKAIIFQVLKNILSESYTATGPFNEFIADSGFLKATVFDISEPFPDSYFLEYSSLRAPPSIT